MANYQLFIAAEYDKQLDTFSKSDKLFIERKMKERIIPQLQSDPYLGTNIKKLKNYDPPTWRYRVGRYRIFYEINPTAKEVDILTIVKRKDAY